MENERSRLLGAVLVLVLLIGAFYVVNHRGSTTLNNSPRSLADLWTLFRSSLFGQTSAPNIQQNVPLYEPVADYENAVIGAVKKVSPAVVSITISKNLPSGNCDGQNPLSSLPPQFQQFFGNNFYYSCDQTSDLTEVGGGSGFIISKDGLILTNKHVAADTGATYTVYTTDGKKYDAKVIGRDPLQDLAFLKVEASDLPTVTLGNSDDLALGQSAIAIGNALGEFQNSVDVGVISGLNRSITASGDTTSETIQGVIQTDAAINPGNSGGPLINLRGEVIGVNVAVVQGAQNIGFALPVNWAKHDVQTVLSGGEIKAPYLGVRYVMLTPELAAQKNLDVNYGAYLNADRNASAVVKNSPADKAGLKTGDIILAVDGTSLEDKDLSQILSGKSVGDKLNLDVLRGKQTLKVSVTLGERPS